MIVISDESKGIIKDKSVKMERWVSTSKQCVFLIKYDFKFRNYANKRGIRKNGR